jgi:hypothetical protein
MDTLRKVVYIGAIIAALLLVGGCKSSPTPTPLPLGSLKGVVSDASTGAPIAGAQVSIAGQVGVFTVTTDSKGAYQAADLPASAYLISAQATGYYVNAIQVGVVSGVVSDGNVTLEPDVAVVVVATPTPAPAPTASPMPTASATPTTTPTPDPTRTPRPSATPRPTVAATASATPTLRAEPQDEAASPTPTPRPQSFTAPRPAPAYAAPELVEPRDGSVFSGPRRITFSWRGPCCLAADEYYVVSIPHPRGVEEAWVKTTSWESPLYLYLLVPDSRQFTWSVSVRRHTGQYPNGQWKGPIVGQISETRRLTWHEECKRDSPLPPPNSPLPAP